MPTGISRLGACGRREWVATIFAAVEWSGRSPWQGNLRGERLRLNPGRPLPIQRISWAQERLSYSNAKAFRSRSVSPVLARTWAAHAHADAPQSRGRACGSARQSSLAAD